MSDVLFTVLLIVMLVAIGWFACYAVLKLYREDPHSVGDEPPASPRRATEPTGSTEPAR